MAWDDNLLEDQKIAAAHADTHARLLAGLGTGKTLTLTRRICFLVTESNISAENILALTFTRAAARELRQRVTNELGEDQSPRISTLHSFALRQLLKNAMRIKELPQPLRIADDWEERNIVLPDLKALLELPRIEHAKNLLNELSADWQSLTADEEDWEKRFPDPAFLGAWREHRQIYGYTWLWCMNRYFSVVRLNKDRLLSRLGMTFLRKTRCLLFQGTCHVQRIRQFMLASIQGTPNGDGINDQLAGRFVAFKVEGTEPQVEIFDLAGRQIAVLTPSTEGSQRLFTWDGRDADGASAAPGLYVLCVNLGADAGNDTAFRTIAVAY